MIVDHQNNLFHPIIEQYKERGKMKIYVGIFQIPFKLFSSFYVERKNPSKEIIILNSENEVI